MKRFAFTLSEIIITLSILGIVAAIMISNISQKIEDTIQLAQFKRAYSILENALREMYVTEGLPSNWPDWPSTEEFNGDNANYFADKLRNYLPVQRYCGSAKGCFSYGHKNDSNWWVFKNIKGETNAGSSTIYAESLQYGKMILSNNMRVSVSARYANHANVPSRCLGEIRVDVNGTKGPNRHGYDVFFFAFDEKGIQTNKLGKYCLTSGGSATTWSDACNKFITQKNGTGTSCSYWIMHHNNMDYKRRNVSSEW